MSNPVEDLWLRAIEQRLPKTLEVDPDLELRLVCGTDQAGQPMFCSISSLKPGIPELSDAVDVARTQRSIDGHWVLLLTLKAPKFTDVFVRLCAHIVDRVSGTSSEAQGLATFMASVEEWRTLLKAPPSQRLSLEAARGLFGELLIGFSNLALECTVGDVIDAWHGPFQSDQDFQFPGGPLVEIKTIHSGTRRIQISSENQLNRLPNQRLFVCVVAADDAVADTPGALTIPGLLDHADRLLQESGVPQSELARRLDAVCFDRYDEAYEDMYFLPTRHQFLEVKGAFPRLEPSKLPNGVSRVSYFLNLADLAPFECSISELGLPPTEPKASPNESR
ncbi:PD-(D/E)XK motif protein [Arthrobacter sp. HY1533]|uniref:PD-(D/E)XK motif protein n=1 Tax=Arthrobacter sp. HY1533 TaxID=2970919 RepID=UPI0022B9E6DA|nr:PD-(D/E)XK motif protein [Arthrobacter sp. HY1533]